MARFRTSVALPAALALVLSGCTKKEEAPPPPPATKAPAPAPEPAPEPQRASATATITGGEGSTLKGTVTFTDTGNGIAIEAHVSGLAPGKHGFHVHEKGECTGDFSSAGAHFNPSGHEHGGPDAPAPHDGDLGNLLADAQGNAMITMNSRMLTLDSGANGVVGRAVVIHEKEDDLATAPSGNSGARIGCGVVTLDAGSPAPETGATGESGASGASGT